MSIQLTNNVREVFAKAIAKAIEVKPRVKAVSYGVYSVESNSTPGTRYTVEFFKQDGVPYASCECKAGQNGNACYHIPAAFVLWKVQAGGRRQVAAGSKMLPQQAAGLEAIERGEERQPNAATFAAAAIATFSTEDATGICACGMSAERCELRRDGNRPVTATTTTPTPEPTNPSTNPPDDPAARRLLDLILDAPTSPVQTRPRFTHFELDRVNYPTTARVADYASPEYQAKLRRAEQDLFG
jgi:hypothetical protein